MSNDVKLTQVLESAKTVCFDGSHFHIEWSRDFRTETATVDKHALDTLFPGLVDTAILLNRAHGRQAMTSWKNLLLNREFLANQLIVETKVGSKIYVNNLENVQVVGNVIQLNGNFHLLHKHRPRDKVLPAAFYLIDNSKKLSSSLSITRTFLDKQFPGFESRLTAVMSLDIPISQTKEQLFMAVQLSSMSQTVLPVDFSVV